MPAKDRLIKVIILYIVERVKGITWNQLINLCISTLYMDYFTFCKLAEDLQSDALIQVARRKGEKDVDSQGHPLQRCDLTPKGEQILATLKSNIPRPVLRNLNRLTAPLIEIDTEQEIAATVVPDLNGGYQVNLTMSEGKTQLAAIQVAVPGETIANQIANNWQQNALALYPQILRQLTEINAPNQLPQQSSEKDI